MSAPAETLKQFTKEQIDILIKKEGKAIVIFEGDVFDATHFKVTHPGGPKFIDAHVGEDITELFYEEEHTKIALRLLNDLKIGTLRDGWPVAKRCRRWYGPGARWPAPGRWRHCPAAHGARCPAGQVGYGLRGRHCRQPYDTLPSGTCHSRAS